MKYLIWIYFSLLGNLISAQTPELFKFGYSYLPEVNMKDSHDSIKAGFTELEISVLAPIKVSDKLLLLLGGTYSMVFPQTTTHELDTRLYFIAARLTTIVNFDSRNRLVGMIIPGISSTLQDKLSAQDFLTQASLGYYRVVHEGFNYGLGITYTSRFGYPLVLPLFALNYKGVQVKYDITLPLLIRATWAYDKNLSYAVKLSVNGSQFNTAQNAGFNNTAVDAVNFSRILFGPEVGIRLKKQLFLTVSGGISFRRLFELNSENGQKQDLGLNNGAFISAKISLKPKTNQQSNNL